METLMGVGFPAETGRAAKGAEGGYSLQFSDKLAEPSRKNQKKHHDTPIRRSVDDLWDVRRRSP